MNLQTQQNPMQETIITEESNNGIIDKAYSGTRIQKPIKKRKKIHTKSTFSQINPNEDRDKLSCEFCGKRFQNTGFLRRHKWTRHDQINEENNELPKKAKMLLQESNNSKNSSNEFLKKKQTHWLGSRKRFIKNIENRYYREKFLLKEFSIHLPIVSIPDDVILDQNQTMKLENVFNNFKNKSMVDEGIIPENFNNSENNSNVEVINDDTNKIQIKEEIIEDENLNLMENEKISNENLENTQNRGTILEKEIIEKMDVEVNNEKENIFMEPDQQRVELKTDTNQSINVTDEEKLQILQHQIVIKLIPYECLICQNQDQKFTETAFDHHLLFEHFKHVHQRWKIQNFPMCCPSCKIALHDFKSALDHMILKHQVLRQLYNNKVKNLGIDLMMNL